MKYSEKFILQERKDGSSFYDTKDIVLIELVSDIHKNIFESWTDDWIYETIFECFENIENGVDEIETDIYTKKLKNWLNHTYANRFMNDAINEGLISVKKYDFIQHISIAQYLAKEQIMLRVKEFIESKKS